MIRALILDFDGLILDTESPMRASWMEIYAEAGLAVSDKVWAGILGASADPPEAYELLEQGLGRPVDRAALHKRRLERELELLANEDILPGVRKLVAEAKACGLLLGVASSSERAWVHDHLEARGLFDPFDAISCAEDVPQTKPAPDLFLHAQRSLGVAPHEAIAFEDSEHGVASAKAAGLFCVAVPNRVTRCLSFTEADVILPNLEDASLDELIATAMRL